MDIKKILSWIPGWLGFLALILVGVAMAIHGLFNPFQFTLSGDAKAGFSIFGLMAVVIGTFSWIVGATSEIKGKAGKVGVKVAIQDLPWWGFLVNSCVLAVAIVVYFVMK